ncbi:MAG: HAMP domain-containing sensor histidine kinase [Cyanobacteria bacterium J06627_28]
MQLIASTQSFHQSPTLSTGSPDSLGLGSTVNMLPLHTFTVSTECAIQDLIDQFTRSPKLPGVVVVNDGSVTMISRQQCLDCLLHTAQIPHFINSPVRILLSQTEEPPLLLSGDVLILEGAQQALNRPVEEQSRPILIREGDDAYHILDADTLNVAYWQLHRIQAQVRYERLQMQILESEKMAALGRLVDGVAHEILDPVSFIWGNLSYISNYAQQQHELLMAYEQALPDPPDDIIQLREDVELDYLRSDLPAAVKSAKGGAHRLKQLATSLQNFCHIDDVHPRPTDINALLDSTLRLLKSRLTTPILVEHCYGKLPPVPCFSGQLSQVFMTVFSNAIKALLSEAHLKDYLPEYEIAELHAPRKITVTTCIRADVHALVSSPEDARWVAIIISDNGPGIPPTVKENILTSFSDNSQYQQETGLTLSYRIITAKHGGKFWLRSVHTSENKPHQRSLPTGTEIEILLPLTTGNVS